MNERRFLTDVLSEPGRETPVATLLGQQRLAAIRGDKIYAWAALFALMPAASRRTSALSVRSQVKFGSVRPK